MIKIPIKTQTIDMTTGDVVKEETVHAGLMPPKDPNACQECGRAHPPDQPHDATKLYYLYAFYGKHGRWPTWKDAVAHCGELTREAWEKELRARGKWSEP